MNTVGMILLDPPKFPPDIRVEKEAKALIAAGYRVCVLCRSEGHEPYKTTLDSGIEVYSIPNPKASTVQRYIQYLTLEKTEYKALIKNFIYECKPQALHVHDLPYLKTVIDVNQDFRLPIIADLHENMPAAFAAYRGDMNVIKKISHWIRYNYLIWTKNENTTLNLTDYILTVVPEANQRLINNYQISPKKIIHVSNTEDPNDYELNDSKSEYDKIFQGFWTLLYLGGIGPHRGLDTAIKGMKHLKTKIPHSKLVIVGVRNEKQKQWLDSYIEKYDVKDNVLLIEWIPSDKISNVIKASDICLVPHNNYEHTQTTVPHKLFQYMIFSKPLLVSDCRPLKRIVSESNSGLIFKADSGKDFSKKAHQLYNMNESEFNKMGDNGRVSAETQYNWIHDAERLVSLYKSIFG